MKYVLVNAFPWTRANGVTSYIRTLLDLLPVEGVEPVCISNPAELPRAAYQQYVRDTILERFHPGEVIIEAPELKAPTRLLPPEYPVHIRLHCPNAIVEEHNGQPVNQTELAEEMDVVRRAHVVSSPSYALLDALAPHIDTAGIHVYKNPPPPGPVPAAPKTGDVVFLGRFSRLKGTDFLDELFAFLPAGTTVTLAGRDAAFYTPPPGTRCHVTVHDEIKGPERLGLLAAHRISLTLSRFENCSMAILESLAMGTPVAGWRVGGNAEIASPDLLRLVRLGDTRALAATITGLLRGPNPDPSRFQYANDQLRHDFHAGWRHLLHAARQRAPLYRGLNCATAGEPA